MYVSDNVSEFFLEWEMFQADNVEKVKTFILSSVNVSRNSCRSRDNVEKTQNALLRFHFNSSFTNAPQCCMIHSVPVLLENKSVQGFGANT